MADDHNEEPQVGTRDSDTRVRKLTAILLVIIAVLFVWHVVSDRLTPYTASARVQVYVIPVVPDVSGYIENIPVKKNQLVQAGDTLVEIETKRFEIAVQSAEAALELAGQDVGAGTADVSTATAKLVEAQTQLDRIRTQADRVFVLEEKGIYTKAKGDDARSLIETGRAKLAAAQAELEAAKQRLGQGREDNPKLRAALAKLEEAQLNLSRTKLVAPSKGFVGGLKINTGTFSVAGQPLMTFLAIEDIWIEANMTENNLAHIKAGDKVEIAMDAYPGQIFSGKVKSTAVGVSTGKAINLGDLPTAQKANSWLRQPQRFPVVIETTDYQYSETSGGVRHNSQVDVIIYTGDGFFWNTVGKIWIRIVSLFSYLY